MAEEIKDGTGQGFSAKVDESNRLFTRSVTITELQEESNFGNGYIITSGFVTFTSANESAILYYKHNEDLPLKIDRFLVSIQDSTGGTQNHIRALIYKNPSGIASGTTVSAAINNTNFGSSNTLSSDSEVGLEGATVTGGSVYGGFVLPVENLTSETANLVLLKGNSIAFTIIPPTGNTSISVGFGMNAHLETHTL